MNRKHFSLIALTLIAGLTFAITPRLASAQFQDAGAKIRGDIYWPSRASGRYIESARNYAREVQTYVAKAPKPEPSVVKDIKTELGRYLDEANKHLAQMEKDFAGDSEIAAGIKGLEKELESAVDHHKAMVACCESQTFDKVATMACCKDLVKDLDKIHAEHVALMSKLATKYSAPTSK